MKQSNKTSLEKSHSGLSNAKLTLICLISSISLFCATVSLALIETYAFMLYICIGTGIIFLLTLLLFQKFKR